MTKITFIINSICKKKHRFQQKEVIQMFPSSEYKLEFHETKYHQHAQKIARTIVEEKNTDIIAVIGGTGTINHVLQEIVYTDIALAIFPTGNGNGYSNYIGLPFNFKEFLTMLKDGATKRVDVGEVTWKKEVRYFLSWFCVGATPLLAKRCEGKAFHSFLGYVIRGYRELINYKPNNEFLLEFHHYENRKKFYEVLIGNIPSFKGRLSHEKYSSVADGSFDVSILEEISYSEVLAYGMKILTTQNDDLFDLSDIHQASTIHIHFNQPTLAQVDFEPFELSEEVLINNLKQQLTLIVPQQLQFL